MSNAVIKKKRPKYLSLQAILFEIRLPLAGWVSILHRVSGALLFAATLWLLFLLERSLASAQGFASVSRYLGLLPVKIGLLVVTWAFCHHFCAGIRFLLMELQLGWDKQSARVGSVAVLVASIALTVVVGVRLW